MKRLAVLLAVLMLAALLGPAPADAGEFDGVMITIEKVVEGPVPSGTTFTVVADCTPDEGVELVFPETGGSESTTTGESADLACSVEETVDGGATTVSYSCVATGAPANAQCIGNDSFLVNDVGLDGEASVTVTVTNDFNPEPTTTTVAPATTEAPTTTAAAAQAVSAAPTFTG